MRRSAFFTLAVTMGACASLLTPSIVRAESYLCVGDFSTGFSFDRSSNSWEQATFRADRKFLLSRPDRNDKVFSEWVWVLKEVGSSMPSAVCKQDFDESGSLHCQGISTFRINRISGRFLYAYLYGYWNDNAGKSANLGGTEGGNTPLLVIGKCSSI